MDWNEISIAIGCALPFLSVAFIGMALTRYFHAEITVESKRLVRRSFAAYALYWIALFAPFVTRPKTDFVAGGVFLLVMFLLPLLMLLGSIYFGLRSRQASGRRVALASLSMIGAYLMYGEVFYLHLVGRVVV